jgi:hypothetical protein
MQMAFGALIPTLSDSHCGVREYIPTRRFLQQAVPPLAGRLIGTGTYREFPGAPRCSTARCL